MLVSVTSIALSRKFLVTKFFPKLGNFRTFTFQINPRRPKARNRLGCFPTHRVSLSIFSNAHPKYIHVASRSNPYERLKGNLVEATPSPFHIDRIGVELRCQALRIGLDVDHSCYPGGHNVLCTIMTWKGRSVKRAVLHTAVSELRGGPTRRRADRRVVGAGGGVRTDRSYLARQFKSPPHPITAWNAPR